MCCCKPANISLPHKVSCLSSSTSGVHARALDSQNDCLVMKVVTAQIGECAGLIAEPCIWMAGCQASCLLLPRNNVGKLAQPCLCKSPLGARVALASPAPAMAGSLSLWPRPCRVLSEGGTVSCTPSTY